MKVIEFKRESKDVLEFLNEIKEEVKKNHIDNLIFCCEKDGEYFAGFSKKVANNYGLMNSLISNMQVVAIKRQIMEELGDEK